jgi:DNA replication licensing factor MCM7
LKSPDSKSLKKLDLPPLMAYNNDSSTPGGGSYNSLDNLPDYDEQQEACRSFLKEFRGAEGNFKYADMLREVANRRRRDLPIELDDLANSTVSGHNMTELLHNIEQNTSRYFEIIASAIDELLPAADDDAIDVQDDVYDILHRHRLQQQQTAPENDIMNGFGAAAGMGGGGGGGGDGLNGPDPGAGSAANNNNSGPSPFPPALMRRYEIQIVPRIKMQPRSLREVKASDIGCLVKIRGIVTRVSAVKPIVTIATYTCDACGYEIYQEIKSKQFLPLDACPAAVCQKNRKKGRLFMQTRGCKFVKFQEVKIQELPNQVPIGHIPRSLTVVTRGELTRSTTAGDTITLSGIFVPTPFTGFRAMRAGLITDTYVEATSIEKHKKSYGDVQLSEEMENRIDDAAEDPDIYSKLSRSLAPEIYGHEDVKKALLLQLVGGVTRKMKDGMKIRGDINICLMGDPGVAKSQLLKHIASVAPRGVYTTGKGSSGVGLTAAIVRDAITQEMSLEGGALVLADMGICCIDEFDKMEEGDRTAIHEVMEQQTVSIAKAGITTTLNARTAVLAAANPLYGRYNKRKSPSENINLPAALLSRFDLMFLILDKADLDADTALARHITYVHANNRHPELDFEPVESSFIRAYISQARQLDPYVPVDLTNFIVQSYVDMRARDADSARDAGVQSVMTARQLLSILRLSQALARLRFSRRVELEDVEESIRLVHMCKASLLEDDTFTGEDPTTRIYSLIRDYAIARGKNTVNYAEIERTLLTKGFTQDQIDACLEEYEGIAVWKINPSRTQITFVNPN